MRSNWPQFYRSTVLVALVTCAQVGSALAGQSPLKGGAMLDCSGLPCVDATTASGVHLKMLIDTGDFRSVLEESVARKLGLEVSPLMGRDGKPHPEYSVATLKDLRIGEGRLGDVAVLVTNLKSEIQQGSMPDVDGSLTYDAFGSRLLRLDYKNRHVDLSDVLVHDIPCPHECGILTTPTFGAKGPPIVVSSGFQVNGRPLTVQIDTLYAGTLLIYPTSVDKLGLAAQQNSSQSRTFAFTDGGVRMIQGIAATEGFGQRTLARNTPVYFATPEVHAPDGMFDGTVGHELFVGHVLTFDFYSHHFWMT